MITSSYFPSYFIHKYSPKTSTSCQKCESDKSRVSSSLDKAHLAELVRLILSIFQNFLFYQVQLPTLCIRRTVVESQSQLQCGYHEIITSIDTRYDQMTNKRSLAVCRDCWREMKGRFLEPIRCVSE